MSEHAGSALGVLLIDTGTGARRVRVVDYLDGAAEEAATVAAHAWIKALRHAVVDGQPLRRRFRFREDSLWWFAELYLHKQQVILNIHRTIAALERLIALEQPVHMRPAGSSRLLAVVGPQVARAGHIRWMGGKPRTPWWVRLARMDGRARMLMLASRASRRRGSRSTSPAAQSEGPTVAAFVHNAFWRRGSDDGSAESYIGPVLEALEARPAAAVQYIGVGPGSNFRARRWWHALKRSEGSATVTPIEWFSGPGTMKGSGRIWRDRHALRRALWNSVDIRRHANIRGCDCWDAVREELAGIALLQWPWSARAMDEAGAALDVLRPAAAVTYAEAGGWGRALILECRRRGIRSAGLQHGFIHRHWLNYRHELDEMSPDPGHTEDVGFPRPTLTLVFDDYARQHLESQGRFPSESLDVTGSPRLDALVRSAATLRGDEIAHAKAAAGSGEDRILVLLVTKYREATAVLGAIAEAVRGMPDVQLAIKTHPAETPDVYRAVAARATNIRVLPADAPLAPLLRASRAVITVNSTVAIDAAVLGIPALVVGLPNNLSPFVDAGLMVGVPQGESPGPALHRILYDEGFRLQLERDRGVYLARFGIGSDGRAAARSADAILDLTAARKGLPAGADRASRRISH
jgi:Capsule polysaccharide biosynthesis protein